MISVIIPVYNDSAGLARCLAALDQQVPSSPDFEVIVVDNNSTHDIASVASRFGAQLAVEKQPGSYAARNAGIARASFEALAFTDADCIPTSNWVKSALTSIRRTDGPDIVAGRIDVVRTSKKFSSKAVYVWEVREAFPQHTYVKETGFGATANLITRRSVFDNVGVFDGSLLSGGDVEWCRRAGAAGAALAFDDSVVVEHPARSGLVELTRKHRRVGRGLIELQERFAFDLDDGSARALRATLRPPLRLWNLVTPYDDLETLDRIRFRYVDWYIRLLWQLELAASRRRKKRH